VFVSLSVLIDPQIEGMWSVKARKSTADRGMIRLYLLGLLDGQTDVEENLSNDILFNEEMMDIVDSVEDEIIEGYLDGSLDSSDRHAVESYFLRPPERVEKLRFARLLRRYLDRKPSPYPTTKYPGFVRPPVGWHSYFKTYGLIAVVFLVSVSSFIFIVGRSRSHAPGVQNDQTQVRKQLGTPRQSAQLQDPMVPLTLVADRSRDAGPQIPRVEIKTSTQRLMVEIALEGVASGSYDVRLETKAGNGPLWSARLVPMISTTGGARLVFEVPARTIESDVYSFAVSSAAAGTSGVRHYDFRAKLVK
jgi:hypothetical protein